MEAAKFVSSYRRDIPSHDLEYERSDSAKDARKMSSIFGQHLHDRLNGQGDSEAYLDFQAEYQNWQRQTFLPRLAPDSFVIQHFDPDKDVSDQKLREFSELNFHLLNLSMMPMWQSFLGREDNQQNLGPKEISRAQNQLALSSMPLYNARTRLDSDYFMPEYAQKRATIEGTLTEIDATIAMLEVAKRRRSMHVLPSPCQFENLDKSLNSDLLAVDALRQTVIGAQVKSRALNHNTDHYDKDHVFIVDGDTDLGNTIHRRIDRKSKTRRVGRAGLISAILVRDLPTKGRASLEFTQRYELGWLMHQKMNARKTVPTMKSTLTTASQHLERKLVPYLESSEEGDDKATVL